MFRKRFLTASKFALAQNVNINGFGASVLQQGITSHVNNDQHLGTSMKRQKWGRCWEYPLKRALDFHLRRRTEKASLYFKCGVASCTLYEQVIKCNIRHVNKSEQWYYSLTLLLFRLLVSYESALQTNRNEIAAYLLLTNKGQQQFL